MVPIYGGRWKFRAYDADTGGDPSLKDAQAGIPTRARGERAKAWKDRDAPTPCAAPAEPVSEFAARAKAVWARLIRKVYEAEPLECPKCKGPMRMIALIEDPSVIRRILEHLGLWAPEAIERAPPPPEAWPTSAVIPLTYHPPAQRFVGLTTRRIKRRSYRIAFR